MFHQPGADRLGRFGEQSETGTTCSFFNLLQKPAGEKSGLATQTSARLKQVLGCLQEFNLLREAMPRLGTSQFIRSVQPADFALP
jgi:hypothetical protein